jgi:hypothetical protein
MTENGKSICGGYLEPAWRERVYAPDSIKSFLFTLKNHAGVAPTKFPKKGSDSCAAFKWRDYGWFFGFWEGPYVFEGGNPSEVGRPVHLPGREPGTRLAGLLLPGSSRWRSCAGRRDRRVCSTSLLLSAGLR